MVFLLLFIFMKNSSTRHKFMTLIMINYVPNNSPLEARAPYFTADAIHFFLFKKICKILNTKLFFKMQGSKYLH